MQSRRVSRSFWDRFWKDERGRLVIFQWPNKWLYIWAGLVFISFFTTGTAASFWYYLSMGVLSIWALLEVVRGASYFRRLLGCLVILFILGSLFKVGY